MLPVQYRTVSHIPVWGNNHDLLYEPYEVRKNLWAKCREIKF